MSETSTSQDPVSYYIDHTIYTGRPADTTARLPKEIRTYDLLDSLGITYTRADHDTLPTMEACQEVGKLLGIEICKNLFLRNTQKTAFYLLILPGSKKFKTAALSKQIGSARLSFAEPEFMERPRKQSPAAHRQRYPGEPSLLRMSSMYQHLQPEIPHRRPVKQDPPCYPP